jgi:hypothetical protein
VQGKLQNKRGIIQLRDACAEQHLRITSGMRVILPLSKASTVKWVGQNPINIRCIYGIFGKEIAKYTVIYGVDKYGSGQPCS